MIGGRGRGQDLVRGAESIRSITSSPSPARKERNRWRDDAIRRVQAIYRPTIVGPLLAQINRRSGWGKRSHHWTNIRRSGGRMFRGLVALRSASPWVRLFFLRAAPNNCKMVGARLVDSRCIRQSSCPRVYRLLPTGCSLTRGFTLEQAAPLIDYLHDLGISDCYASPLAQARPGSAHGYDVTDPSVTKP